MTHDHCPQCGTLADRACPYCAPAARGWRIVQLFVILVGTWIAASTIIAAMLRYW